MSTDAELAEYHGLSSFDKGFYDRDYHRKKREDRHEIGELPGIADPFLRKQTLDDLLLWFESFFDFEPFFSDPFGPVQIDSIRHEEAVLRGKAGNINKLEPRGYGKSTRSILSKVWSILRGSSDFDMVCSDSKEKADDLLTIAQVALWDNEKLLACFPELFPFWHLDGNIHSCRYQTFDGVKTGISITGDTIVFPKLGGKFPCEGAMLISRPYRKTRGKNVKGKRPATVTLDDVQAADEAIGVGVRKNLKTLTSDIAYLGSRKHPVRIINNATIREPDDFPSQVAEMDAFTTIRYKMVEKFPDGCEPEKHVFTDRWHEYFAIRRDYEKEIVGARERAAKAASLYYWWHRREMDAGSSVTWDYAYSFTEKQEISTIQAAMNFIMDFTVESFFSECQNMPISGIADPVFLTAEQITQKQHHCEMGVVPDDCSKLVAYIDFQMEVCFFEVWGFAQGFDGYEIMRGPFPDQRVPWFEKRSLRRKLSDEKGYETSTLEARLEKMAMNVSNWLLQTEFRHADGRPIKIDRLGWDTGKWAHVFRTAWKRSPNKNRIVLCKGAGYGAKKKPQRERPVKKYSGARKGFGWFLGPPDGGIQTLEIDTNLLKTFYHQRFATDIADPGSFSLYKAPPTEHDMKAAHDKAEFRQTITGPYGDVDEWEVMPGKPDNDYFDCGVGCAALGSFEGIRLASIDAGGEPVKRRKADPRKWSGR